MDISSILTADLILTDFIVGLIPHNAITNHFFSFFSLKGNSILIWLFIMGFTVYLEERKNPGISERDKKFTFIFFTTFILTSIISIFILKNVFERPRPTFNQQSMLFNNTCPVDYSFPSAHASTAFAAAAVLSGFDKKRRMFYYFVAAMIALSRIYLGCHYLLDIAGGAVLGYFISKIMLQIKLRT